MKFRVIVSVFVCVVFCLLHTVKAYDIAQWLPADVILYVEMDNIGELVSGVFNDDIVDSNECQKVFESFGEFLNQGKQDKPVDISEFQIQLIEELRSFGADYSDSSLVLALYLKQGKPTLLAAVKSDQVEEKTSKHAANLIGLFNATGITTEVSEGLADQLNLDGQQDQVRRLKLEGSSRYINDVFMFVHDDWCVYCSDRSLADEVLKNSKTPKKRVLFNSRKFKQHIGVIRSNVKKSSGRLSLFLNTNYLATGLIAAGVSSKDVRAFGIDRITGISASIYLDHHEDHHIFAVMDIKVNVASPKAGVFLAMEDGGQVDHFPFSFIPKVHAFQALDFDWKSAATDAAKTYDEIYGSDAFDKMAQQMIEIEMPGVGFHDDFLDALGGTTGSAYSYVKSENSMRLTSFTKFKTHERALSYASKAYLQNGQEENQASFEIKEIGANSHLICQDDRTVARQFEHAEKIGLGISKENFEQLSVAHLVHENWVFTGERKSLENSFRKFTEGNASATSTVLVDVVELCRNKTKHDGPFFMERVVTYSYWQKFVQHLEYVIADLKQSKSTKQLNRVELRLAIYKFFQANFGQHVVLGSNTDSGIRFTGVLFDGDVWNQ